MKKVLSKVALIIRAVAAFFLLIAAATSCNDPAANLEELSATMIKTAESENFALDMKITVAVGNQQQKMTVYAAKSTTDDRAAMVASAGGNTTAAYYLRGYAATTTSGSFSAFRRTTLAAFWEGDEQLDLRDLECEVSKETSGPSAVYTVKITDKEFIEEQLGELDLGKTGLDKSDFFTYKYTVGESGYIEKYAYDYATTVDKTRVSVSMTCDYTVGDAVTVDFSAAAEAAFAEMFARLEASDKGGSSGV